MGVISEIGRGGNVFWFIFIDISCWTYRDIPEFIYRSLYGEVLTHVCTLEHTAHLGGGGGGVMCVTLHGNTISCVAVIEYLEDSCKGTFTV